VVNKIIVNLFLDTLAKHKTLLSSWMSKKKAPSFGAKNYLGCLDSLLSRQYRLAEVKPLVCERSYFSLPSI
jgi:hypothetical protein